MNIISAKVTRSGFSALNNGQLHAKMDRAFIAKR